MDVSLFELFSVGIGPSSSHTNGPMTAACDFVDRLREQGGLERTARLEVTLYGSLAATGRGHGTFGAVLLGLEGNRPEIVLPDHVDKRLAELDEGSPLVLGGDGPQLDYGVKDMVLEPRIQLPRHPNGMTIKAFDDKDELIYELTSFSIGGGFVVHEGDEDASGGKSEAAEDSAPAEDSADASPEASPQHRDVPYPFFNGDQLLARCQESGLDVAGVMMANEAKGRTEEEVREGVLHLWQVMEDCKNNSLKRSGCLPGGLKTRRRAPEWHKRLSISDPEFDIWSWVEWVNLVALAVNEENASGGRIVTAPTNGAAGVIPAVIFYANHYTDRARQGGRAARPDIVVDFLLAAGAVGVVIKQQASISGAEVGCQGEVGSAASMAAAGLAQVMGGSPDQVSKAAEIAMEHHLGMTCDPIGGLVQVPCIERNAIAAVTAVNAARMALMDPDGYMVSLDQVIATMKSTGADMSSKYKETAEGGLAVNVPYC